MDRVSNPSACEALSFPVAVRRLARDAHRLLDPSTSPAVVEFERVLDQAAALRKQTNRPAQADLARWLDLLCQQIEDCRAEALGSSMGRRSASADYATSGATR